MAAVFRLIGPLPDASGGIFLVSKVIFRHTNTNMDHKATFFESCDGGACQSYFREPSIPYSSTGCTTNPAARQLQHFPEGFGVPHKAALTGVAGSDPTWHGMPTALVKNKHFLN
jgi:hypothetical protein